MQRIRVIDSHTAGEPTRTVLSGVPDLGVGSVAEKAQCFSKNYNSLRTAIVCEPRGHEAIVGALLCEPSDPECSVGVIFFNNVKVLGMCGHGTIGLMSTLHHLGRLDLGTHKLETPAGVVTANLLDANTVEFDNVPAWRSQKGITLEVPGVGPVQGDVAYGGNWFFLTSSVNFEVDTKNLNELLSTSKAIKNELQSLGITGDDGAEIDHIEIFGVGGKGADSRNFVLCPGNQFDRSPCGTGTSAKLACLYEDGNLAEGQTWVQESVLGTRFSGSIRQAGSELIPTIRGAAFVTSETDLLLNPEDPLVNGIRYL